MEPVLRRIAKYAKTRVPHSSATAEMVDRDWNDMPRYMAEVGRRPGHVQGLLELRVHPQARPATRGRRAVLPDYSGMDLEYWQEFYLLGEAEQVAERIRGKIEALGGVDHLILNPLNWEPEHLEVLARDVLPLVTD